MAGRPRKGTRTISATEFKTHCLAIIDEVQRTGDEVTITKHGRAVARLVAPETSHTATHGSLDGTVSFVGDPTRPDDAWDLDASIFPEP